jgi:hypothetical protein
MVGCMVGCGLFRPRELGSQLNAAADTCRLEDISRTVVEQYIQMDSIGIDSPAVHDSIDEPNSVMNPNTFSIIVESHERPKSSQHVSWNQAMQHCYGSTFLGYKSKAGEE